MYPPPINSRPIATAIGISNPPTVITQPSIVARPIETPASRSRITLCRYSGRWSLYFDTRVLITNRLLTRPFSTIRSGSGATLTPSAQPLQARFSRLVATTMYSAGFTSSRSLCS
jgi:hypothetical protein